MFFLSFESFYLSYLFTECKHDTFCYYLSSPLTFSILYYAQLATEEAKNFRDRNVFIVLAPNKAVLQKSQEPPKKKDKPAAVNEVSAAVEAPEAPSLSQK